MCPANPFTDARTTEAYVWQKIPFSNQRSTRLSSCIIMPESKIIHGMCQDSFSFKEQLPPPATVAAQLDDFGMSIAQQIHWVGALQATAPTFLQPEQNASTLAASQCSLQFEAIYKCSCDINCLHTSCMSKNKRGSLQAWQQLVKLETSHFWLLNGLRRSQGMCQDSFSFKEQLPPISECPLPTSWCMSIWSFTRKTVSVTLMTLLS